MSLYVILITQGNSPRYLSPQQLVSELMVVCGEGGEVFMVPTQQGQRKPKRPTHKDLREERIVFSCLVGERELGCIGSWVS